MPESRSADKPAIVVYESCVRPSQMRRHRSTSPSLPDSLAEKKSPRESAVREFIQAMQPGPSAKAENDDSEAASSKSSNCLATPALASVIPLTFVGAEAASVDENATEADEASQKSDAVDLQVAPTRRSVAVQTDNELLMALSPLPSPYPRLELPFCPLSLSPRPLSLSPRPLSLSPRPLSLSPRPLSLSPRPLSLSPRPLSLSPRCLQSYQPLQLRRVARMSRRRQRRLRKSLRQSLRQQRQKLASQSTSETDETVAMPRLNWTGQAASSDSEGISVSQAADMATYGLVGLMWLLLLQWVLMAAIDAFSAQDSNFRERTADWE